MSSDIVFITTDKAPKPLGHYSQATIYRDTIYVAAQLGIIPNQDPIKVGSIAEQVTQTLKNIQEILIAAGSNLNRVLKVNIYVSDISLLDKINSIYTDFFAEHKPARAVIPVKELHLGFQVAIDVIAATGK
jgi:2-iminobutanoate/2-iminopropanoate deaminase